MCWARTCSGNPAMNGLAGSVWTARSDSPDTIPVPLRRSWRLAGVNREASLTAHKPDNDLQKRQSTRPNHRSAQRRTFPERDKCSAAEGPDFLQKPFRLGSIIMSCARRDLGLESLYFRRQVLFGSALGFLGSALENYHAGDGN